jgi:hypothetical protein
MPVHRPRFASRLPMVACGVLLAIGLLAPLELEAMHAPAAPFTLVLGLADQNPNYVTWAARANQAVQQRQPLPLQASPGGHYPEKANGAIPTAAQFGTFQTHVQAANPHANTKENFTGRIRKAMDDAAFIVFVCDGFQVPAAKPAPNAPTGLNLDDGSYTNYEFFIIREHGFWRKTFFIRNGVVGRPYCQ